MQDFDNQLQINLSITVSPEALAAAREPENSAHTVVTFAYEDGELHCCGEISLRLTIKN